MTDEPRTVHFHDWGTGEGWGVIIGLSRCLGCGETARIEHFPAVHSIDRCLAHLEPEPCGTCRSSHRGGTVMTDEPRTEAGRRLLAAVQVAVFIPDAGDGHPSTRIKGSAEIRAELHPLVLAIEQEAESRAALDVDRLAAALNVAGVDPATDTCAALVAAVYALLAAPVTEP